MEDGQTRSHTCQHATSTHALTYYGTQVRWRVAFIPTQNSNHLSFCVGHLHRNVEFRFCTSTNDDNNDQRYLVNPSLKSVRASSRDLLKRQHLQRLQCLHQPYSLPYQPRPIFGSHRICRTPSVDFNATWLPE